MTDQPASVPEVSIIIPVLDKLEFTRQCLDRIARNTGGVDFEVVVVDNGSTDGTRDWFETAAVPFPLRYHRNDRNLGFARANNIGAGLARGRHLLFLNNDTLVQPGWLSEMLRVLRSDRAVGIVGIKQLFPYTNSVYHIGVVFAPGGTPQHLYPHLDASLPYVNREREYQAVNGACLLIAATLFEECGGFDEAYLNGYEDTDLCMQVRARGRKVVCCTSAFIYHYAQISEGRTADDDRNAALFASRWSGQVRIDRDEYIVKDGAHAPRPPAASRAALRVLSDDCIYLADDLGHASAFTWVNVELALALAARGAAVLVSGRRISPTVPADVRKRLAPLAVDGPPVGGVQVKWSHYWPRHLDLEIHGNVNLEFFVTNYAFGRPGTEPWDYWLQSLKQNHRDKLPVSEFCASVLEQIGIPPSGMHVLHHGYSREVDEVDAPASRGPSFRFLTVTNSHDLPRYNTTAVLDAFDEEFGGQPGVTMVVKDYGATSGNTMLRDRFHRRPHRAAVEYLTEFTDKRDLIRLYKSCDAFVSAHRGEGFGMKILDAMACGLPVIVPLFGGPSAYCTPDNCYPVEFGLVPVSAGVDREALPMTNQPIWAEVDVRDLRRQMRCVYDDRPAAAIRGRSGQTAVLDRFSWDRAAARLVEIASDLRTRQPRPPRSPAAVAPAAVAAERSPYWLGLRVSVVVPTKDRKDQLLICLDALARQSVLPQEFEVLVVDDGSSDGTREALDSRRFPFSLRYFRQESAGPGAARNLGIERAAGELVMFIGDDIFADERLLEEHLLAHARHPAEGTAVLGHIDWPSSMTPNAVMEYVCGEGMLQFAYPLIPQLPALDHRFFYTSNISLRRQFLMAAADAGIRFDPCFRHAAFEDSEFAYRLMPRGLDIRYAAAARAVHDHWMDLDSFAAREHRAGQMAVVFYRKHPGHEEHLQVRWIADLVAPAAALLADPGFLRHVEAFDVQTDALLRAFAGSLEELLAMQRLPGSHAFAGLSADRLRAGLHNVLRVIFDVHRARGKVEEWYAGVADPAAMRAAQSLGAVLRKIEFLTATSAQPGPLQEAMRSFDHSIVAGLKARIGGSGPAGATPAAQSASAPRALGPASVLRRLQAAPVAQAFRPAALLRRMLARPAVLGRLLAVDRRIQARLQAPGRQRWLERYRRVRSGMRRGLG